MLYIVVRSYDCLAYSNMYFAFLVCLKCIVFIKIHKKKRDIELEIHVAVEHTSFGYLIVEASSHPLDSGGRMEEGE